MTKKVIHRFSKEEDAMIIEEVKKQGDIRFAIDIHEQKLGINHSRRSILSDIRVSLAKIETNGQLTKINSF